MSSKLFLKFQNDSKFHVVDEQDQTIGAAYEIPDSYAGFSRLCVAEKPDDAEADTENFMAMLAELAGMKVTKLFDDNVHFLGYTMEPIDKELREFLAAESASEKYENELVNAMGSYLEDD